MFKHSSLLCTASLAAIAIAGPAIAQETTEEENRGSVSRVLQTVEVTATKKANVEDVQSVPIAITAFNADSLDALNVQNLEDLSYSTPNVSLDDIGTSRGTANFAMRGLGVNSSIPSIDPAVGVFVDGVYLGINNGVIVDLFDIDSVELARGPQGLLFGRNTTGGAVIINTGNPTDEFTYKGQVRIDGPIDSDRGGPQLTVQGVVSGPLVDGVLNGKLGVYHVDDAGYFKNLANGENHGEIQSTRVRGALEWFASPELTFLGKLEYADSRTDGPTGQNRGVYERDTFDFAINSDGEAESEALQGSLRTDYDVSFGDGTITNILGYRSYESVTLGSDIDALPITVFHSDAEIDQEQISNELRYAGSFGNADVTTGLYYFNQDLKYTEIRNIPSDPRGVNYGGGEQDHTVFGLFGQLDYAFTDRFTGIFGLRYSSEEKDAAITYIEPRAECSFLDGSCPITGTNPITGGNNGFTDSDDWSNVTPKVGFQYFYNDNAQIYGNYTRGFRSGGYNFRITAPAQFEAIFPEGESRAFDEETVDSFEVGVKMETEDGRGQLNTAVFFTQIEDMQREVNVSDPIAGVVQTIVNTADADIAGLELEGRYAFGDNFLVTANLGLIEAEYQDVRFDISGDGAIDGADLDLSIPRVPEVTWGVGAIYDVDMGEAGLLTLRANYQYRDEFAYTDNNFGFIQQADILRGDITWQTPYDGLSLSLFGNNLLDEVQAGNDTQLSFGGAFAGFAPGGQNLSTEVAVPFADNPTGGTFSPLKKGRVVGVELTFER
ncbi:MAG: TonB-dependent receptor [Pseudomonadota bacterium]